MKLVFDIDGVVCSNTWGKYAEAQPYPEMIKYINELYDAGNTITFYSARGFGSCRGNLMAIIATWFDFTNDQLKGWGVKYHSLVLGKPDGAVYIDDRAFKVDDDGSSADQLRKGIDELLHHTS